MNEIFLLCALALPVTSIPPTSLYTTENGSIKVARMLMLGVQSNNRNVLLIGTHHDWTYFLRESGYNAWRLTENPQFKNDIKGTVAAIPVEPHSMILTIYAGNEPKDEMERFVRQLTSTLIVNGFLVFDGTLCPTIFKYLSPFNYQQVPVPSHGNISIWQRIDIFGDYHEGRRFLNQIRRGLSLISSGKAYYLTWDRMTWMQILSRRITQYDHNTFDHSSRTATLMVSFGRFLGWSNGDLEDGRYAAWLHDYGKIAIPKNILIKPASLTDEEWAVMQTHAGWGMRLLSRVPAFRGVADIVIDHHEHFDGTGYPDGKKGDEISKIARALAIVDAYDVITSERPYKHAKTPAWAAWELKRCAGTQFDPELVDKFLAFMGLKSAPNFLEPPMFPPDVKMEIPPNDRLRVPRLRWSGPRVLFVGGPSINVSDMRRAGWKAFGALTEDRTTTPWHVVCEAGQMAFLNGSFGRVIWLQENHFPSIGFNHYLIDALQMVSDSGFFIFDTNQYESWPDMLLDWGWNRVPIEWGSLSVWSRGPFAYRGGWAVERAA